MALRWNISAVRVSLTRDASADKGWPVLDQGQAAAQLIINLHQPNCMRACRLRADRV